jgi:hypothetical protein
MRRRYWLEAVWRKLLSFIISTFHKMLGSPNQIRLDEPGV